MQHSYIKVFQKPPGPPSPERDMIIPQIDEIEMLDFMLIISGSVLLEYNETDPETMEERIKLLHPHTGYIHPIRSPENQNVRCLKFAPGEEFVTCMVIDRLKFRKIVLSVSVIFFLR